MNAIFEDGEINEKAAYINNNKEAMTWFNESINEMSFVHVTPITLKYLMHI